MNNWIRQSSHFLESSTKSDMFGKQAILESNSVSHNTEKEKPLECDSSETTLGDDGDDSSSMDRSVDLLLHFCSKTQSSKVALKEDEIKKASSFVTPKINSSTIPTTCSTPHQMPLTPINISKSGTGASAKKNHVATSQIFSPATETLNELSGVDAKNAGDLRYNFSQLSQLTYDENDESRDLNNHKSIEKDNNNVTSKELRIKGEKKQFTMSTSSNAKGIVGTTLKNERETSDTTKSFDAVLPYDNEDFDYGLSQLSQLPSYHEEESSEFQNNSTQKECKDDKFSNNNRKEDDHGNPIQHNEMNEFKCNTTRDDYNCNTSTDSVKGNESTNPISVKISPIIYVSSLSKKLLNVFGKIQ